VEQRSRKPLPGRPAHETLQSPPSIPVPHREPDLVVPDDEIDSDAPAQAVPEQEAAEDGLTEREREILAFEKQSWRHAGAKEQAIRDSFNLSGTRYYQLLNALLDKPAALAHDPVLVGRLRRLRGSRTRVRGR
jgi:Protein of unknown function (DUF3263)